MGTKRWTVRFAHDPDDGCGACPNWSGSMCEDEPDGLGRDDDFASESYAAPDWCPLRALPDAEEAGND